MAAAWILSHLQGADSQKCLDDVLRTWASRDGGDLARWADAEFPKHGHSLISRTMRALGGYAPVWFARMSEMECNRGTVWSNTEFLGLRAPGAAKAISSELQGHVAYTSDPAEMRRALNTDSSGRHAMGKWGWNELFETTAVRWHAENPAACDQWLATWPENAQAAARHFINQSEAPAKAPPETAQASDAKSTTAAPQAQPLPLPDAAAPSTGTADQQVRAWGQWWHRDTAGAEAFLNTASWPEGLKFTALAQTYAGMP
ncbi:MAG: hypothetical protein JWM59_4577 [Verrucomicrobiales bacterium]|nr:hypothetical protein [Verrucomicrobiales bacterium]